MRHCAQGVWLSLSRLPLAVAAVVAGSGLAAAAELEKSGCSAFCSPVTAERLDDYRAQGLAKPVGGTALSVILWDEYRRVRARDSGDIVPTNGIALPGGTAFVNTASTIR
jgi:hypothetical protein